MIVRLDQLSVAMAYLSGFASSGSVMSFTPAGDLVRLATTRNGVYAEYDLPVVEPLAERFAISAAPIIEISKYAEAGEMLSYVKASSAKFSAGPGQWWIPFTHRVPERPVVDPLEDIEWDGSFGELVTFARSVTKTEAAGGCLDCVLVETKANRRTIVGTNNISMAVFDQPHENDSPAPVRLLIERSVAPLVARTCETKASVQARIGLYNYEIQCGRRSAIFPRRRGTYPKWETPYARSKGTNPVGWLTGTKSMFVEALRQSCVEEGPIRITAQDGDARIGVHHEGQDAELNLRLKSRGKVDVTLSHRVLSGIVHSWPFEKMRMQYLSATDPIKFTAPRECRAISALVMPVQPIEQHETEGTDAVFAA